MWDVLDEIRGGYVAATNENNRWASLRCCFLAGSRSNSGARRDACCSLQQLGNFIDSSRHTVQDVGAWFKDIVLAVNVRAILCCLNTFHCVGVRGDIVWFV